MTIDDEQNDKQEGQKDAISFSFARTFFCHPSLVTKARTEARERTEGTTSGRPIGFNIVEIGGGFASLVGIRGCMNQSGGEGDDTNMMPLAHAKAREAPRLLQHSVASALI